MTFRNSPHLYQINSNYPLKMRYTKQRKKITPNLFNEAHKRSWSIFHMTLNINFKQWFCWACEKHHRDWYARYYRKNDLSKNEKLISKWSSYVEVIPLIIGSSDWKATENLHEIQSSISIMSNFMKFIKRSQTFSTHLWNWCKSNNRNKTNQPNITLQQWNETNYGSVLSVLCSMINWTLQTSKLFQSGLEHTKLHRTNREHRLKQKQNNFVRKSKWHQNNQQKFISYSIFFFFFG